MQGRKIKLGAGVVTPQSAPPPLSLGTYLIPDKAGPLEAPGDPSLLESEPNTVPQPCGVGMDEAWRVEEEWGLV